MTKPATPEIAASTAPQSELQLLPSDLLMNLIVSMLAPMFIWVSSGDINFDRLAALQTVNAY